MNAVVSVALCTYNGAKYLKAQLDSILSQSYPPLEIIVVDDNSNDNTKEILENYQQQHAHFHVHYNNTNLGYNKNFEKAISLCTGEYISISDQDDIWHIDKIEKLVKNIDDNWAIFSNSNFIDENGKATGKKLIEHLGKMNRFENILLENFFTGHTSLISRDILTYIIPMPEKGFYDWWIGFVALYHNKLKYVPESLTDHRLHTGSVIQRKVKLPKNKKNIKGAIVQLEIFSSYKYLNEPDKVLITGLKQRFESSQNQYINGLLLFLLKNYLTLFPKRKHTTLTSRINYLRKFLRN